MLSRFGFRTPRCIENRITAVNADLTDRKKTLAWLVKHCEGVTHEYLQSVVAGDKVKLERTINHLNRRLQRLRFFWG